LSHDDSPKIVNEVKEQGFEIHGPDVNTSNTNWSIDYDNKCFRVGLRSIKGLGEKAVEKVLATRPYASIKDFMLRSKANKTALEAFIKSEAFGSLDTSEFKSYRHMFGVLVDNKAKIKDDETYKLILDQYAGETKEWSIYEKIKNQIETIGFYDKNLVIDKYIKQFNEFGIKAIDETKDEVDKDNIWVVIEDVVEKTTKNRNNKYKIVKCVGKTDKQYDFKVWKNWNTAEENVWQNGSVIVLSLKWDPDYGYSLNKGQQVLRC